MRRFSIVNTAILITGLTLSVAVAFTLYQSRRETLSLEFFAAATSQVELIRQSITSAMAIGKAVSSFYDASVEVTRDEFTLFVSQFLDANTPVKAIEWVPRVMHDERAEFEANGAKVFSDFQFRQISPDSELTTRSWQPEYYPVFFVEPYSGNERALGLDLASSPLRFVPLAHARDQQMVTVTQRLTLVQANGGDWGLISFFPIYRTGVPLNSIEDRQNNFRGVVAVVFDVEHLLERSFSVVKQLGIEITVTDSMAPEKEQFIYSNALSDPRRVASNESAPVTQTLQYSDVISVADRVWRIDATPARNYFDLRASFGVWIVLITGAVVTILLVAYVRLIQQRQAELSAHRDKLEREVANRTRELERSNKELESYSYSIAHDLRAPLRAISGFSSILRNDARAKLSEVEIDYFDRVVAASVYMSELITNILDLARLSRMPLKRQKIDLSKLANTIAERLNTTNPERTVTWLIQPDIVASGDTYLVDIVMENLLGNAFKFTSKKGDAVIEFGITEGNAGTAFFVRDNGIGFNMSYYEQLFGVFQRLHHKGIFEGTGIGLATVKRIVERHGGVVWGEAKEGEGATFYFTLSNK